MRVAVIGGGVAGRSVAAALAASGVVADVYDAGGPRASEVPTALCHAFPGRTFVIAEVQRRAWQVADRWYGRGSDHVREVTIHRQSDPRLERTLQRAGDLPVKVCLDGRGTSYRGFVVAMKAWVAGLNMSGEAVFGRALTRQDGETLVVVSGANEVPYDRVIHCPGAGLGAFFPEADIRVTHGELLVCDGQAEVARFGRSHVYPGVHGGLVVGHTFTEVPRSAAEAEAELRAMATIDGIIPGTTLGVWTQSRTVVHPDRWPILTELTPQTAVLGGLGAKGLLFSPYLAESVARWVTQGDELPVEFRWPRVSARVPD